jgi:RNA polymerase sigma-70 factor, ECF subfamily
VDVSNTSIECGGMREVSEMPHDRAPGAGETDGSYEWFVHRHFDHLEKTLTLITLDEGLAADAAQEAFLRAYLKWPEVRAFADPVGWLYRVGINRCHDYRRQLKRAARLFDRLAASRDAEEPWEEWAPSVEFLSLLRQLSKQQRVAAVLFYAGDFYTAEIANIMHVSESAVKTHLARARESLQPVLKGS